MPKLQDCATAAAIVVAMATTVVPAGWGQEGSSATLPDQSSSSLQALLHAAEQGDATAQNNLGLMYANGEGVPENHVLAYAWWDLAAAQGHESAQENKGKLSRHMTKEQVAEAQALSLELLARMEPDG